jgi:hypothetical protein
VHQFLYPSIAADSVHDSFSLDGSQSCVKLPGLNTYDNSSSDGKTEPDLSESASKSEADDIEMKEVEVVAVLPKQKPRTLDGFFKTIPLSIQEKVQGKLILAEQHKDARDRNMRKTPAGAKKSANRSRNSKVPVGRKTSKAKTYNKPKQVKKMVEYFS